MKKVLFTLLVATAVFATSGKVFAQYEKGDKLLNVGIAGGGYGWYSGGFGVGVSGEYGIHEFISVGAQVDFRFYSYGYNFGPDDSYLAIPIAARGSYHYGKHFLKIDQLDLYAGPTLGFNIDTNEYYDASNVVVGAFAGAKWYFKPSLGVFAELGAGTNMFPIKAGVSFKF